MSDMAGYAARVAVERSGSCRDTMEPRGASDIDGQTERSIWAERAANEFQLLRALCARRYVLRITIRATFRPKARRPLTPPQEEISLYLA